MVVNSQTTDFLVPDQCTPPIYTSPNDIVLGGFWEGGSGFNTTNAEAIFVCAEGREGGK